MFEKLKILFEHSQELRLYLDINEKIEDEILESLPFSLPSCYVSFMSIYNGCILSWCTIIPKNEWDVVSRGDINNIWEKELATGQYYPIAISPSGDLFCLNKNGEVVVFDIDEYNQEDHLIAKSFESFIEECVLGSRYSEFCDIENDEFYNFLKSQGWA